MPTRGFLPDITVGGVDGGVRGADHGIKGQLCAKPTGSLQGDVWLVPLRTGGCISTSLVNIPPAKLSEPPRNAPQRFDLI